jgi:SAM-dependent methyltransferase
MDDFYGQTLAKLLERGILDAGMRVLVCCGGKRDREALLGRGFRDVTISNLDDRMQPDAFAPYAWSYQDAEQLGYADDSFDFAIAHSGLHHCRSPHRGLLELYRVARRGLLVFEPRDSALVRLGVRLDFGQEYETAAVAGSALTHGGVRNGPIPNYVYRWTEREIEKTLASWDPLGRPRLHYFYALRVPEQRLSWMKNRVAALAVRGLLPLLRVLTTLAPRQANNFAFCAEKVQVPRDLHPWLEQGPEGPRPSRSWLAARYSNVGGQAPPDR